MLQSHLFTKASKNAPKDETSFNAQTLIRAGFIDKLAAGIYTYLPLGVKVLTKINGIIREEMENIGGQEVLMPALHPRENWEATGRWKSLDEDLFKLSGHDKKEYALGATHEEILTPLLQKHALSYKDFPQSVFQIQTKYRNELRAKAGLIRGREFVMKDLYSFHTSEKDLDDYYEVVQKAYFKVYERCGLLDKTYLTYASGGTFSKFSHEYQTLTDAGEDTIYICDDCNIAINDEIIEEQTECPGCGKSSKKLKTGRAVEVGNIFKLKTKYSSSFNYKFTNKDGKQEDVIMGCYGIGSSRIMGTIVEVCNDDKGIIWPKEVAPFHVHLVEIAGTDEKVSEQARDLYKKLLTNNYEVLYDDRKVGAGQKFAESDLIGCPIRIVISEKTLKKDSVEFKRRNKKEADIIKISELINKM